MSRQRPVCPLDDDNMLTTQRRDIERRLDAGDADLFYRMHANLRVTLARINAEIARRLSHGVNNLPRRLEWPPRSFVNDKGVLMLTQDGPPQPDGPSVQHHPRCDALIDYPWECTCGASRPKAHWFDHYVSECEKLASP
jgi:hypothetical protein